jgi:hypothetical protein
MRELIRVFNYKIKLIIAISLFFAQLMSAHANVKVNISIEQAEHHLAIVELKFDEVNGEQINFSLPTWRTGRYETLNLANGIRNFIAKDSQGNVLSWRKLTSILGKLVAPKIKRYI